VRIVIPILSGGWLGSPPAKGPSGNKVYIFAAGPQARWQGASDEHTRCGM